jgi:hypothetical protein
VIESVRGRKNKERTIEDVELLTERHVDLQ